MCSERTALGVIATLSGYESLPTRPSLLIVDRRRRPLSEPEKEELFVACERLEEQGWRLRDLSANHRLRDVALQIALARSATQSTILFLDGVEGIAETDDPARTAQSLRADAAETDLSATGLPYAVSARSARFDQLAVRRKPLRGDVRRWIAEYDSVGKRGLYLWRWCLHGIELTTFPDVAATLRTHVHETKLLSVILCVLFDDVADCRGRPEFLDGLIQAVTGDGTTEFELSEPEARHLDVTCRLWREYESRLRKYPRHREFGRLLKFDLSQFFSAMRYAHLVNGHPGLLNRTEHDVYTPHNMLMVSFSTIDLMGIPTFDASELGCVREAMWHAQAMGRIGNVVSTWRREMNEEDYSSVMFLDDAAGAAPAFTETTGGDLPAAADTTNRQAQLLEKWRWHRGKCRDAASRVQSITLDNVLSGHDRFWDMHLASTGLI